MSDNKNSGGGLEAEPFAHITFRLEREHGTQTLHEADCPLSVAIGGLKSDLTTLFGSPAQNQRWYYNTTLMGDDRTLLSFGIDGRSRRNQQIIVKV
uniref:Ubiquitin-like domain-containing protein n=1 Tax=Arion vulgaris TaxID=1028688 RepID=A0A0B7AXP6_9EUPU